MDHFSKLLSRFAVTMLGDTSIQAMLDRAARETVDLLPIDGAGVVIHATASTPEFLAASGPEALQFEELQHSLRQGPCFVATASRASVAVPDLSLEQDFPDFTVAALRLGLRGAFAFPLRRGEESLGTLDLYRISPGALGEEDMQAAQTLADVLTAYVGNAQARAGLEVTSGREHDAVERLQVRQEERNDFVSTVIHELGSPIASIAGFTELLEEEPDDLTERQRGFVAAIHRNSDRLRTLAEDLLTLFSLEPGAAQTVTTVVDLRDVVAGERTVLAANSSSDLAVGFELPDVAVLIRGDAELLERMLSNLLSNAVKYTPAGGSVTCVLRRRDGYAEIEVSDTGIGIPADEQGELFTRFFRASTARKLAIPGTGLGLAIVRSVVDNHGGTVTVSSVVGEGTRFLVLFPLA